MCTTVTKKVLYLKITTRGFPRSYTPTKYSSKFKKLLNYIFYTYTLYIQYIEISICFLYIKIILFKLLKIF